VTDHLELSREARALLDRSPVGVTVISIDGKSMSRVYANPAAAVLLGYAPDEIAQIPPTLPVAPEQRERMAAFGQESLAEGGPPAHVETVILRRDGTRVPVEASLSVVRREGNRSLIMAIIFDITERVRAQEQLRVSEARFRSFAELAPDSITVIARGRMAYANACAARTFGFESAEELCARPLDQLVVAEDLPLMFDRMRRVREGEKVYPSEYRAARKDGSVAIVEIHSVAIEYEGQPALLALGRDAGERRRLQAELMRTDRMATIGLLAASVAHEINNPLTYVLLALRRLRLRIEELVPDGAARAEALGLLDEAREGGDRVVEIVRELLQYARAEPASSPPTEVDVTAALEAAVRLAGSALAQRAQVVRDYHDVPRIRAHDARLTQVFLNLVVNAAQSFESADHDRNQVRLSVRAKAEPREVIVEIADNGPGIPQEHLAHIFDPFFTTKLATGTGLGLTVSRSIIEGYGGTIEAETSGAGTVLRVRLAIGVS
jgi:PAS domain S-box-containing protein